MKKCFSTLVKGLIALVMPVVLLTSCFESSAVIKVNKDGSGIVHQRSYVNDAMGGMMGGMLGGLGGDADVEVEESGPDIPSEDDLKEQAAKMGEGVSFQSVKESKNKSGWGGYEVIFAFEDINKLKFNMDDLGSGMESMGEEMDAAVEAAAEEAGEEEMVSFTMKDGVLEIRTPEPDTSMGGDSEGEEGEEGATENPFGDFDPADPEAAGMLSMMSGMFQGMRMGLFVEAADPIKETNARHQKGQMVTLLMMDMGKVFTDMESITKLTALEGESDRAVFQETVDGIEGMTADLTDPITITFE